MAKISTKKSKSMKGKIYIRGYTRKDGSRVKGHYAKDMGAKGRTPKSKRVLPKLKKGEFHRYGYRLTKSSASRHRALLKAIKSLGYSSVLKRLVVLRTYSKSIRANRLKYDKDIKGLQAWRLAHPKSKRKSSKKRVSKKKSRRTSRR